MRSSRALVLLIGALALAAAAWLAFGAREGDAPTAVGSDAADEPRDVAAAPAAPATIERASAAREELAARPAEPEDASPEPDAELEEEPEYPPTPESPGPDQALLRIEAVALETGAPIAGVDLSLSPTDYDVEHEWKSSTQPDPSRGLENDWLVSDASGRAEFVLEAEFAYTLRGTAENGLADEAELELAPFAAGEARSVRLALPTAWTREWHGRIVDGESERPLVGVNVVAYGAYVERIEDLVELTRARSGADGRVVLRLPAWEHALVRCEADGWFPGGARIGREGGTAEEPQAVKLRRPAALVVRVREADGSAAAGVGVRVTFPPWFVIEDWVGPDHPASRGVTDAGGRCELAGLPAAADLFVTLSRGERVLEWTSMAETFQLASGERRELGWTLEGGSSVRGRVCDREGRAVAELELALSESSWQFPSPWPPLERWISDSLLSERRVVVRARTDAEGRFAFDSVRPGCWYVEPGADDDDVPDAVWPFVLRADGAPRELELRLDRDLWIEGRLLGPDGEPADGANVSIRSADGLWSDFGGEWTGRDGTFALGPLLDGRYIVSARAPEEDPYFAPCEEVELDAGTHNVVLALRWGGRLAVAAAGPDGSVLDGGVSAMLFPRRDFLAYDDDHVFYGLVPGAYDVVVTTDDDRIGVARGVGVVERATREVVVTVGAGVRVVPPPDADTSLE